MKKLCWNCLKFMLLIVIIISSSLTIYIHFKGSAFDPIREIQKLKIENRRDDALDLVRFFRENQIADQDKFTKIEKSSHEVWNAFPFDNKLFLAQKSNQGYLDKNNHLGTPISRLESIQYDRY